MSPQLGFFGAAETVTGSRHLLAIGDRPILIDCGLFQGPRDTRQRNWDPFPIDPRELDAVIVTHAHIDHIGWLPRLVDQGFEGPIYSTPATFGLALISLPDSARLQEEEAKHRAKVGSRHNPPLPLYTEPEAYACLTRFRTVTYDTAVDLPGGASFRFLPAGHILGSAFAEITLPDGQRLMMSGDLGRYDTPIIRDPAPIFRADWLVLESTYGDRFHALENPLEKLAQVIDVAVSTGGAVVVPSFAIGRTQELLYYLRGLQDAGRLPRIPIYIDSPMAVSVTHLYAQAKEEHDADMRVAVDEGRSSLEPDGVHLIRDREDSKALNARPGPLVIISGSGMANGGRVTHHLMHRLENPSTIVLFTGYQAEGTLGRRLLDGEPTVRIHKREVRVRARIERVNALSAHADQGEILRWLRGFVEPPKTTFLVHGEPSAQAALKAKIEDDLGWSVVIPKHGESFPLAVG
jgi:metallo-beta-lactamase family protein